MGGASAPGGQLHACTYRVMTDLGTLPGGDYSETFEVNAAGDVAGVSNSRQGYMTAFRCRNGVMEDLGQLPHGIFSWACGINDAGDVVGATRSVIHGAYYDAAFLHDAEGLHDLNDRVRASDRKLYQIEWANDINNHGDIAGAAVRRSDNQLVAVILKKID